MEFTRPYCAYSNCRHHQGVCVTMNTYTLRDALAKVEKSAPTKPMARTETGFEIEVPFYLYGEHQKHWIASVFTDAEKESFIEQANRWIKELRLDPQRVDNNGHVLGIAGVSENARYTWAEWPSAQVILGLFLLGNHGALIGYCRPHTHGN